MKLARYLVEEIELDVPRWKTSGRKICHVPASTVRKIAPRHCKTTNSSAAYPGKVDCLMQMVQMFRKVM